VIEQPYALLQTDNAQQTSWKETYEENRIDPEQKWITYQVTNDSENWNYNSHVEAGTVQYSGGPAMIVFFACIGLIFVVILVNRVMESLSGGLNGRKSNNGTT
jgi:hypothetical protein